MRSTRSEKIGGQVWAGFGLVPHPRCALPDCGANPRDIFSDVEEVIYAICPRFQATLVEGPIELKC